jgi:cysteine desulfuration protein SufE
MATHALRPTDVQVAIAEEFALLGDWSERYQYLIDLGRRLPAFPLAWRVEANRLHGCQSLVWLVAEGHAGGLHLHAASDSAIVSGLIALVLRVYSGRTAAEILATQPDFVTAIGLGSHLSPTRSNGLAALLARVTEFARAAQQGQQYAPPGTVSTPAVPPFVDPPALDAG